MSAAGPSTGLRGTVLALSVGEVGTLVHGGREVASGFRKTPTENRVQLDVNGLAGDQQGDLTVHGGPEKAVCVYSFEHYPAWEAELELILQMPAFGENLTTLGLLESDVFLGDTFRWGSATVQVSQPRRPCFKVAARHGIKDLAVRVEDSLRTGFYFRVLQPGRVSASDNLVLTDVEPAGISVADVSLAMNGRRSGLCADERNNLLDKVLRSRTLLPQRWIPMLERLRSGAPALDDRARLSGTVRDPAPDKQVGAGSTDV